MDFGDIENYMDAPSLFHIDSFDFDKRLLSSF